MPQLELSASFEKRQKAPAEIKVLSNYIYEYKKGIRPLVLYTFSHKYEKEVTQKLEHQQIPYLKQKTGKRTVNLFFGKPECLEAIAFLAAKPLYSLSPEEDFILGALLGYDICRQCERYCLKKKKAVTGEYATEHELEK